MLQDLRATLVQNHVRVIDLFRQWDEDESGFFGSSNLSVTAWQPGGGGAVVARLSPAGGAGEYCCVPPPLRSRVGRYSEWLLLDVKADGR